MAMKREMTDDTISLYENGAKILSIKETEMDESVVISLSGSLRSDTVHDFQDELSAIAAVGIKLLLDFNDVSYFSSSCAQVLLNIQQQIDRSGKGELVIRNVPAPIMKELDRTGFSELLLIEE